jgi:hypothetical protein
VEIEDSQLPPIIRRDDSDPDVFMILWLLIIGRLITGRCESSWHDRVVAFLGRELPVKVPNVKG